MSEAISGTVIPAAAFPGLASLTRATRRGYAPTFTPITASTTASTNRMTATIMSQRMVEPSELVRSSSDLWLITKVRFFDADREFFSIYFAEFGNVSPHHLPAQQPFLQRYMEQVALLDATLQQAAAAGIVRASVLNGLGYSVLALTASVIARRLRGWSHSSIEDDVNAAVDLLWKGLAESHA